MHTNVSIITLALLTAFAGSSYAASCPDATNVKANKTAQGYSYSVNGTEGSQWVYSAQPTKGELSHPVFEAARIQIANNETDPNKKKDWAVLCRYKDSSEEVTLVHKPGKPIEAVGDKWENVFTVKFDNEVKAKTKTPNDAKAADILSKDCVNSSPAACTFN